MSTRAIKISALVAGGIVLSVVLFVCSLQWGPGVHYDSIYYMNGADNISAGKGYTASFAGEHAKTITTFPPLTSYVLSIFENLGNLKYAVVNSLFFCIFVITSYFTVKQFANGKDTYLVIALFAACISPPVLDAFSWIQSEVVFLPAVFLSIYGLSKYCSKGKSRDLIWSGAFMGLALMTRYAGAIVALSVTPSILLAGKTTIGRRIKNAVVFLALSFLPLAMCFIWHVHGKNPASTRPFDFKAIGAEKLMQLVYTLDGSFVPGSDRFRVFTGQEYVVLFAIIMVLLALFVSRRKELTLSRQAESGLLPYFLVVFVYPLLLIILMATMDSTLVLDMRLLSVSIISLYVVLFYLSKKYVGKKLFKSIAMFWVLIFVIHYAGFMYYFYDNGRGDVSRKYINTKIVNIILNDNGVVYTNKIQAGYYLVGKRARPDKQLLSGNGSSEHGLLLCFASEDSLVLSSMKWSSQRDCEVPREAVHVVDGDYVDLYSIN